MSSQVPARAFVRVLLLLVLPAGCALPPAAVDVPGVAVELPRSEGSLRFAVIGDAGTGGRAQRDVAQMMDAARREFPFELVLMLGDNLYGAEGPDDFRRKFELPYAPLLEAGVEFYATLGNHDEPTQKYYGPFHMAGREYYSFRPAGHDVRFFSIYSEYLDRRQREWLEEELRESDEAWKICFFHHPIYASGGRYGSNAELREVLEPLFVRYGVDAVFSGHEHLYERTRPQHGITYFVSGAAGKLRRKTFRESRLTAIEFDDDYHFMLVEIARDRLHFQTITRTGRTIDRGVVERREQMVDARR